VTPKLRFAEFNQPWLGSKLGDYFTFKNGVNADKSQYGRGRKFINVMDVISAQPILHDEIIGSVEISEAEFAKNEVRYGDVLFQRSSETREEVGQSNIYLDERPATFGGFVIRGRPKSKIEPRYFDALLRTASIRKDMTSRSGGSTRYNIGQESLEAVSASVAPTFEEQQKIADFLGAVDERIGLLQRRRDGLQRFKKGMMQRLFTQSLRFTRPDGTPFPDWEEKRLGEIAKFLKGRGVSKADVVEDGQTPCIRYAELYTTYGEVIQNVVGATNERPESLLLSKANDVIIPASGETPTDIGAASCVKSAGIALGGDLNVIRTDQNGEFLARYLRHGKRRDIARVAQGNSVVHLYPSQLATLKLQLPHPDEQHKIAEALGALDDKIAAVSDQITHMQAFKKGLLQQMFV
jgi:type I restriction enzyme, S subunit